ncbi:hypothetical protein LUZ60_006403 [Juncus effusus]|nr:hypothetical protein LUZ60_006403 [Juncus effusus]
MADASSVFGEAFLDVDDFPSVAEQEEEGELGVLREKLDKAIDLVKQANCLYRDKRYEEAISLYSKALILKPGDHYIIGNRSAAFCCISQHLKKRSATESEYQPLNGLDPMIYAELALKDAEKILNNGSNSLRPYLLKANVLFLLERYEDTREALLEALQIEPLNEHLQSCLKNVDQTAKLPTETRRRITERSDDFDCTLCFKLLYEPVTTPCGHSFCRHCLHQSMDHSNKCPMCRTVLFITPRSYPISVVLNNVIQKNFPEEFSERKTEHENVIYSGLELMPLFVMDVILPCQKLQLNIFEPRYRLMVRRVMEGNHRMGMAVIDPTTGTIADFGCEVELIECEPLPDGRFYIEIEGRRRFRILSSWDQDGYRVAQVEWVHDTPLPDGSLEKQQLIEMANGAAEMARTCMGQAREVSRTGRRHRNLQLFDSVGIPGPQDPEKFSFWLLSVMSLRSFDKLDLLRMTDTRERLARGVDLLKAQEQGCRLQ